MARQRVPGGGRGGASIVFHSRERAGTISFPSEQPAEPIVTQPADGATTACVHRAATAGPRAVALLAAVVLAAAAACSGSDGPSSRRVAAPRSDAEPARYVGGDVCAGCHADAADAWGGSHHDLAMQHAEPGTVLGDFADATFTYAGVTTRFFARDGRYYVRTDGPDGEPADFEITHTFGVEPLQQYLVEMPDGRLQALGIAWDTRSADAGGQRWFHLYPGQEIAAGDPLHWTAPAHNWNGRCAACHSTAVEKRYVPEADRFDTRFASIDVACEACHGPGSAHAAAPAEVALGPAIGPRLWDRADGERIASLADTVAASGAESEVCAQCHSRRAQLGEMPPASAPLLDRFIPARLDDGLYHADGQILDEVFVYGSFVQSAMHRAGVTCSDCHDPHSTRLVAAGNALCTRCHAAQAFDTPRHHRHAEGTRGAFCVDCHMREQTYMVVDGRRDHSFRVPRPDLSVRLGTPNACGDCHPEEGAEWAAERLREWFPDGRSGTFHYGEAIAAGRTWSAERAPLLARVAGDRAMPAIARSSAVRLLAEQPDAAALDAVTGALEDPEPLVQLGALEALDAFPAQARAAAAQRFLTHRLRALRITAARVLVDAARALSARRRADLQAALNEYFAAQRYAADRGEGWLSLGAAYAAAGRVDAAETAYREAIEREPAFAPAYVNLADLYRSLGREPDAQRVLRDGLAANPDDAALNYALGLSEVRAGRIDAALAALERATDLAPGEPAYPYALGLALMSAGAPERALERLECARRRFPGHAPTLLALATHYRDRGELDRALERARSLLEVSPGDASARGLLRELERRSVGRR